MGLLMVCYSLFWGGKGTWPDYGIEKLAGE